MTEKGAVHLFGPLFIILVLGALYYLFAATQGERAEMETQLKTLNQKIDQIQVELRNLAARKICS